MDILDRLQELSEAAAELVRRGLVLATGGNVSLRVGEHVYISPTGARLDALRPETFALVHMASGQRLNEHTPSSELPMHLACYRTRPETVAVIHCHPPHIIALASLGWTLPAMTADFLVYMDTLHLPLVPYITPGTENLAAAVAEKLQEAPVVLLGNHGIIATGPSVQRALDRVLLAEESARIYLLAKQHGQPRVLNEEDWHALREAHYGQKK